MTFDDSAERVFQQFEADVREMTWDVRECEVLRTDELDRWAFEHCIVLFADKTGVFNCFLDYIVDVLWGVELGWFKEGEREDALLECILYRHSPHALVVY